MTVLWIDVSHHDRNRRGAPLDWQAIKSETSPVMIARATYGDPSGWHRDSPFFDEFQTGAREAGFVARGAYHNLIHGDPASIGRQVDWLRATRDRHGCNWVMADIEPYSELVSAGLWPRWDDVRRFHDQWYQREAAPIAWYIPRWYWADRGGLPSLGQPDLRYLRGPLIQSHYSGGDGSASQVYANAGGDSGTGWDDEYGGRRPEIWQFTSDANVGGASDRTDVNAFRGSIGELLALTGDDDMGELFEPSRWGPDPDERTRATDQHVHDINLAALWGRMVPVKMPDGTVITKPWMVSNGEAILAEVRALAAKLDPEALRAAAAGGAQEGVVASVDEFIAALLAALPPDPDLTKADVEAALRNVLRSVPASS